MVMQRPSLAQSAENVYLCISKESCPGERAVGIVGTAMCRENHAHVPCCGLCVRGYFLSSFPRTCGRCERGEFVQLLAYSRLMVVHIAQLLTIVWIYSRTKYSQSAASKVFACLLSFAQMLRILGRLQLELPYELEQLFTFLDRLFTMDGILTLVKTHIECLYRLSFTLDVTRMMSAPLFITPGLLALMIVCRSCGKPANPYRVINTITVIWAKLFTSFIAFSMELLIVLEMPNKKQMLVRFPTIQYGSTEWLGALPVVIASFFIYVILFYAFACITVVRAPQRVQIDPNYLTKYGPLLDETRPARWWWSLIVLTHAALLNAALVAWTSPTVSIHVAGFLEIVYLVLHIALYPYREQAENYIHICISIIFALISYLMASFVDQSTMAPTALEELQRGLGLVVIVLVFLAGMIACSILLTLAEAAVRPIGNDLHIWRFVAFRDEMAALSLVPDAEFLKKLSSMNQLDCDLLNDVTALMVSTFATSEPGLGILRKRLTPNAKVKPWHPAETLSSLQSSLNEGSAAQRQSFVSRGHFKKLLGCILAASSAKSAQSRYTAISSNMRMSQVLDTMSARNVWSTGGSSEVQSLVEALKKLGVTPSCRLDREAFAKLLEDVRWDGDYLSEVDEMFALMDTTDNGWTSLRRMVDTLTGYAAPCEPGIHYNAMATYVKEPMDDVAEEEVLDDANNDCPIRSWQEIQREVDDVELPDLLEWLKSSGSASEQLNS